jgi:hypothetical protein
VADYYPAQREPLADDRGFVTRLWDDWFVFLRGLLTSLQTTVESFPGVLVGTLAAQPSFGVSDAGKLYMVSDYGHLVRWTGTAWEFAHGDPQNGFFEVRAFAPQGVGWQLCDGSATDYLTVGGVTLTATPFTTPNAVAGTFLKALAVYTGAIDAAVAPGLSGSTQSVAPDVAGNTEFVNVNFLLETVDNNLDGSTVQVNATASYGHSHADGTLAAASHAHGLGTIAADAAARPPSLGGLLYFRR